METAEKDGILLAHGGIAVGYALHLRAGRAVFAVRTGSDDKIREISSATFASPAPITVSLAADATMSLKVGDQPAVTGKALSLLARQPQEDFCVGHDNARPTANYSNNAAFKGRITKLQFTSP